MIALEKLHEKVYANILFKWFTWGTRVLLAIGFFPSGLKKLLGQRFTLLGIDSPVGFFFEAMYQTGIYWHFLGFMQVLAAILLLIPRTTTLGALLYFPILVNIFLIIIGVGFRGTPYIVGLMLLANLYLICWDYPKIKKMVSILFEK